jgi:hypothetical protein
MAVLTATGSRALKQLHSIGGSIDVDKRAAIDRQCNASNEICLVCERLYIPGSVFF